MIAALAITAALYSAPAHAQFKSDAELCTFTSTATWYDDPSFDARTGPLVLSWRPATGEIVSLTWTLDGHIYAELSTSGTPGLLRSVTRNGYLFTITANVDTHLGEATVRDLSLLLGQMLVQGTGDRPEEIFSGFLWQTGSGWLTAHGNLTCGP